MAEKTRFVVYETAEPDESGPRMIVFDIIEPELPKSPYERKQVLMAILSQLVDEALGTLSRGGSS